MKKGMQAFHLAVFGWPPKPLAECFCRKVKKKSLHPNLRRSEQNLGQGWA